MADLELGDLKSRVNSFINGNFADYDHELNEAADDIPQQNEMDPLSDIVKDEVHGWTALFSSQNYSVAAQSFERCYEKAKKENIREFGAFYGWCWAKARYLRPVKEVNAQKLKHWLYLKRQSTEEAFHRGLTVFELL